MRRLGGMERKQAGCECSHLLRAAVGTLPLRCRLPRNSSVLGLAGASLLPAAVAACTLFMDELPCKR